MPFPRHVGTEGGYITCTCMQKHAQVLSVLLNQHSGYKHTKGVWMHPAIPERWLAWRKHSKLGDLYLFHPGKPYPPVLTWQRLVGRCSTWYEDLSWLVGFRAWSCGWISEFYLQMYYYTHQNQYQGIWACFYVSMCQKRSRNRKILEQSARHLCKLINLQKNTKTISFHIWHCVKSPTGIILME